MNILNAPLRKTNVVVVFSFLFVFLISSIASAQRTYAQKIKVGEGADPLRIISTSEGGNALLFSAVLLRKINASGKKVWQRDLDLVEDRHFFGRGVAELSDGGYILTGDKRFAIDLPLLDEAWLIKLTSGGRVDWKKRFFEANSFESGTLLSSVVPSTDGGFWAAGSRGRPEYVGFGNGGVIVSRFDSSGKMRWGKVFSDDFFIHLNFLPQFFVTSDQELIVVSQLFSSQKREDLGTLVLKLDADGNLLWKKLLKKKGMQFTSGSVTTDGGCILLFNSASCCAYNDVIRLSSNGNVLWKTRFRVDSQSTDGFAVVQTAEGGFTIAGVTYSDSGAIFLAKLDSAGKVSSAFSAAISVSYGKLFLSASDSGYAVFGQFVFGSSHDAFLLKLDSNANLAGCNLFSSVTFEKRNFGALKTSNPAITISDWTPREGTFNIGSKNLKVTSSPFCP